MAVAAGTGARPRGADGSGHALALGLIVAVGVLVRALQINVAMRYRPTIRRTGLGGRQGGPADWASRRALASGVWEIWNRATPLVLELVIAAGFAAGLIAHRRIGRQPVPVSAASLVVMGAALAVGVGVGRFPRYWLVWLPFYLLTAGAGLAWLAERAAERVGTVRRLAPAVPVALGAVLAVLLLAAGHRGSEAPPQSDSRIAEYLRDELKPGEVGMDRDRFAPAVDYYLSRAGLPRSAGAVTPPMRQTGRAILIVPSDEPQAALQTLETMGGIPGNRPPVLLRRFEYISVWDVAVAG